jgi:hypothetical protein
MVKYVGSVPRPWYLVSAGGFSVFTFLVVARLPHLYEAIQTCAYGRFVEPVLEELFALHVFVDRASLLLDS